MKNNVCYLWLAIVVIATALCTLPTGFSNAQTTNNLSTQEIGTMVRIFAVMGLIREEKLAQVNSLLVRWGVPTLTIDDIPGGEQTGPYVAPIIPAGAVKPSLVLYSPNGGETYRAGSGDTVTIKLRVAGAPTGSRVCTMLQRQSDGKHFAFPGNESCRDATNGTMTITSGLVRTSGYDLGPGTYRMYAQLLEPKRADYKSSGELASDSSDRVITLTDANVPDVAEYMSSDTSTTTKRANGDITTLKLLGPEPFETIYIGNPVPVRWTVLHAPANTRVEVSLKMVRAIGTGGTTAGGTWVRPVDKDGEGYYRWPTGYGHMDVPGLYEVVATLAPCSPAGCYSGTSSAPYAKSKTVPFYFLPKE